MGKELDENVIKEVIDFIIGGIDVNKVKFKETNSSCLGLDVLTLKIKDELEKAKKDYKLLSFKKSILSYNVNTLDGTLKLRAELNLESLSDKKTKENKEEYEKETEQLLELLSDVLVNYVKEFNKRNEGDAIEVSELGVTIEYSLVDNVGLPYEFKGYTLNVNKDEKSDKNIADLLGRDIVFYIVYLDSYSDEDSLVDVVY